MLFQIQRLYSVKRMETLFTSAITAILGRRLSWALSVSSIHLEAGLPLNTPKSSAKKAGPATEIATSALRICFKYINLDTFPPPGTDFLLL
jgi:hypothetical protein